MIEYMWIFKDSKSNLATVGTILFNQMNYDKRVINVIYHDKHTGMLTFCDCKTSENKTTS